MNKRTPVSIIICILTFMFSDSLCAEGGIYFRCVSGVNEYLLSEGDNGFLSYINLKNGYVNFIYQDGATRDKIYISSVPMNGGGQTRIRFNNQGYDYYLYEITHHSGEDYVFKEGVAVVRDGKVISNKECENGDSTVRQIAYSSLGREEYAYDLSFE